MHQAAAVKLDPIATEALAILEKKLMEDVSKDAQEVEYVTRDIDEIRLVLALPEEEFVRRQVILFLFSMSFLCSCFSVWFMAFRVCFNFSEILSCGICVVGCFVFAIFAMDSEWIGC